MYGDATRTRSHRQPWRTPTMMTREDLDVFFADGGCDVFTFREGKIAVKRSFLKSRTA
jgi:hypothetical protein